MIAYFFGLFIIPCLACGSVFVAAIIDIQRDKPPYQPTWGMNERLVLRLAAGVFLSVAFIGGVIAAVVA